MRDLRTRLGTILRGRVCLIGVGQADSSDDGFGVRLAEALQSALRCSGAVGPAPGTGPAAVEPGWEIILAGTSPERCLGRLAEGGFDRAVFLDAVELGAAPGSVTLLDSAEMASALPQVSTHRLSLGLLARLIEAGGRTKVWLLGVQLESLARRGGLSPTVQASLQALLGLMLAARGRPEIEEVAC